MRHIRFICFITLLALIPYGLHVWLWSWADGLIQRRQEVIIFFEVLAGVIPTVIWLVVTDAKVITLSYRAFCALCSNELKLWKGGE